jgi:hypothetical protein
MLLRIERLLGRYWWTLGLVFAVIPAHSILVHHKNVDRMTNDMPLVGVNLHLDEFLHVFRSSGLRYESRMAVNVRRERNIESHRYQGRIAGISLKAFTDQAIADQSVSPNNQQVTAPIDESYAPVLGIRWNAAKKKKASKYKWVRIRSSGGPMGAMTSTVDAVVWNYESQDIDVSADGKHWFHVTGRHRRDIVP